MKRKILLLGAVILVSGSLIRPSQAQWYTPAGSSEEIDLATGKPAADMGTKNYDPERYKRHDLSVPHSEPIFTNGRQVGRIDQHGEVYDDRGRSVGLIDPKDGTIIYNGRQAGYVDANGDIHDDRGRVVTSSGSNGNVVIDGRQAGRVDSQGSVYDDRGRSIGQVSADNNAVGALMLLQNQH
ncbi:hypothetical protein PT277_06775 [Acetobacteraceae bacterium ESL0709]|nr:hypothetical protein [Acetobacteraceae bacterium ESL0697]MDF7678398.1 hypothetical protein [Acetobacteraceae bacterium ESL0709]